MTTAETTYARHHANSLDLLSSLTVDAENMPAPSEDTNWADVGDMVRIETMLRGVLDVMRGEQR
jgi:hypothetical protein